MPAALLQVNIDEDPELKELFSGDTFPRVMLWSKRSVLQGGRAGSKGGMRWGRSRLS